MLLVDTSDHRLMPESRKFLDSLRVP